MGRFCACPEELIFTAPPFPSSPIPSAWSDTQTPETARLSLFWCMARMLVILVHGKNARFGQLFVKSPENY
jgi:hypothetical protein